MIRNSFSICLSGISLISPSFLKNSCWIQDSQMTFFSQHLKFFNPLPSGFQCFCWEICLYSHWGFLICDGLLFSCFEDFLFSEVWCVLVLVSLGLFYLELVELFGFVVVFSQIWELLAVISFSNLCQFLLFFLLRLL